MHHLLTRLDPSASIRSRPFPSRRIATSSSRKRGDGVEGVKGGQREGAASERPRNRARSGACELGGGAEVWSAKLNPLTSYRAEIAPIFLPGAAILIMYHARRFRLPLSLDTRETPPLPSPFSSVPTSPLPPLPPTHPSSPPSATYKKEGSVCKLLPLRFPARASPAFDSPHFELGGEREEKR